MQPNQNAPSSSKKGMPNWAKVLIAAIVGGFILVALIIAAVVYFVNSASAAPVEVSNNFIDTLQAKDTTAAYALTGEVFQKATSQEKLALVIPSVSAAINGDEKIIGKSVKNTNGNSEAAVVYSVEVKGKTKYVRIVLQKEESTWKVVNFRLSSKSLEATTE